MMPTRIRSILPVSLVLASCGHATPSVRSDRDASESLKINSVIVGEAFVAALPNRFVLLRKNGEFCAVIFKKFWRLNDRKAATRFNSGEENTHAEYDWYYQADRSGDFGKVGVVLGHGELHRGPSIGFGFDNILTRSADKRWLDCGSFKPTWLYPTTITFTTYVGTSLKRDGDMEIAPSNWTRIEDVNINDPKLRWFKMSSGTPPRAEISIPRESLP